MNEQELNKKLAEWVGFHKRQPEISVDWWRPDGQYEGSCLPDFPHSLDACFKWLVPKLNEQALRIRLINQPVGGNTFFCAIGGKHLAHGWAEAETLAIALCLAIEKLIDGKKE